MRAARDRIWDRVDEAIAHARVLTVRTTLYHSRERAHIDRVLGVFLDAAGMGPLKNKLSYCLHELAGNAKKANTKRLFFAERKLRIHDPAHYAEGMAAFREDLVLRVAHYHERLRREKYYIKVQFRLLARGLQITVLNNAQLTGQELVRVREKQAIAERYACLADAYSSSEDRAEGAGLGIVMMLFMLKNLGFGADAFSITSSAGQTAAVLTLTATGAASNSTANATA